MRLLPVLLLPLLALWTCTCAHPAADTPIAPLPEREPLATTFDEMPGAIETRARVLDENVDAWVERVRALESAKESIDVTYFIVDADAFGLATLGLLAEKASGGVKVRIMVDGRGSWGFVHGKDARFLGALTAAGADVRLYNPVAQQIGKAIVSGDLRAGASSNHDKIIVVDDDLVIIGGRNITEDYLSDPQDLQAAYTDMDVALAGRDAATRVTEAFDAEWTKGAQPFNVPQTGDEQVTLALALAAMRHWITDKPFSGAQLKGFSGLLEDDQRFHDVAVGIEGDIIGPLKEIPPDAARKRLKLVTTMLAANPRLKGALQRPRPREMKVKARVLDSLGMEGEHPTHAINDALISSIVSAKKSIVLQSPYLVLSEREVRALEGASARGVEITFLTNSPLSSDSPPTQGAFLEQWPLLLARVARARIFVIAEMRLMHAKVFVVDDKIGFIGSYNLDPLSRGVNSEIVVAMWGDEAAPRLGQLIHDLTSRGAPGTLEYRIKRGKNGSPIFGDDGQPLIEFGPEDHLDARQLAAAKAAQPFADVLHPFL